MTQQQKNNPIEKWAEDLNRCLHTKGHRHMKRCSTSLIFREMQVKTTMRYYLTLPKMTIIKKSTNNKCQRGCGEKEILLYYYGNVKLVQPLCKIVWRFLRKTKNRIVT